MGVKQTEALKLALEALDDRVSLTKWQKARDAVREALAEQLAKQGCSRSHPHENMDAMCELRTEIARLTNENARLKARHQDDEINAYRMTLLCIRDGLQQGMSKSIQKLQAREINDVLGLPSFASYRTSPQPSKPCEWRREDDIHLPDTWRSDCGVMWTFTDGGPVENDMKHCCGCEAKLREKNA